MKTYLITEAQLKQISNAFDVCSEAGFEINNGANDEIERIMEMLRKLPVHTKTLS